MVFKFLHNQHFMNFLKYRKKIIIATIGLSRSIAQKNCWNCRIFSLSVKMCSFTDYSRPHSQRTKADRMFYFLFLLEFLSPRLSINI
jgi:hypothetical protein